MGSEQPRTFSETLRIRKEVADDFSRSVGTNNLRVADVVRESLRHNDIIQVLRELANGDRKHEYRELHIEIYGDDWLEIGELISKLRKRLDENDVLQLIFKMTCQRR